MKRASRSTNLLRARTLVAALAVLCGLASCADEEGPQQPQRGSRGIAADAEAIRVDEPESGVDSGLADAGTDAELEHDSPFCKTPRTAEPLPARSALVHAEQARDSDNLMFVKDLFGLFRSHCGGCHVDNGLGNLRVLEETFATTVDSKVLARIFSKSTATMMPPASIPGAKLYEQRAPGDPVVELATLLQRWIDQGRRTDVFSKSDAVSPDADAGVAKLPYQLTSRLATSMSNLGTCIPDPMIVGKDDDELDTLFARMTTLPERLSETDLFTLDSEELARHRTIAYAPTYPLWSDDAGKQRYVHLPRGKTAKFDKDAGRFVLPDNTRFYKTFLKKVVDAAGNVGWRKIETRVTVSRLDPRRPGEAPATRSLYGTYLWNNDETEATLLRDPLRNGQPFRDRLITVVTHEQNLNVAYRKSVQEGSTIAVGELQGATRGYAVPGSQRCDQCHMGRGDFVLGFDPIQLRRRPLDEGGVIERADEDELSQLERLIDYGLFSDITSQDEVLLLENQQGARRPRNVHELRAQGYMVGNCMHCHNPYGFPSWQSSELLAALNFLPSADKHDGGVFQFPLDRVSPRVRRGPTQDTPIPYLSPSLDDVAAQVSGSYKAKMSKAPWQSMLYRNTESKQTYDDDFAVFPHMPMNSSGYDCRAPLLMGNWMLSVVARPARDSDTAFVPPFVEVPPSDPAFAYWSRLADQRLEAFHKNPRVAQCSTPADIVRRPIPGDNLGEKTLSPALDAEGTPRFPTYLVSDFTEIPGDWLPRRPDWKDVLVDADVAKLKASSLFEERTRGELIESLRAVSVSSNLRSFVRTPQVLGQWKRNDACDFSSVRKVGDLTREETPRWISSQLSPPEAGAPLYELAPGEAVFQNICSNCHGRLADATSNLAGTILSLTGGETRVADLRNGLFGPVGQAGTNLERVFGTEDWASRYMLWMTLGGTQRLIPQVALKIVGSSLVLDQRRGSLTAASANMLSLAIDLCARTLPVDPDSGVPDFAQAMAFEPATATVGYRNSPVITDNGDAELWEGLCRVDNPVPVRALKPASWFSESAELPELYVTRLYPRAGYGGPVGGSGQVFASLTDTNTSPWCLDTQGLPEERAFLARHRVNEQPIPECPTGLRALTPEQGLAMARRGAMNAGLAVFVFLDDVAHGRVIAQPRYDECEQVFSKKRQ